MKRKHPTSKIQLRITNGRWPFVRPVIECSLFFFFIAIGHSVLGSTNAATNAANFISPPRVVPETARGFYNAGTEKLCAGKWNDAEPLLESSLAKQDERIQPVALFNLGHVRFAQGMEELKKSPSAAASNRRTRAATEAGDGAIQKATEALAGNDIPQMVAAYFTGRGVRKELGAATVAVQRALEAHGKTLLKWQRSLSDFQGAAELNPADTNAIYNADLVAQAIAKLVDSMKQMQQSAAGLTGKKAELGELLKQLKGRIPAPNMPPGAAGDDGEEEEPGKDGKEPAPESLAGLKENQGNGGGQEMDLKLSPENAGALLNSLQPDGKPLPIGQGEADKLKNYSGRIW